MQHEVKKLTLIANELTTLMLLNGAEEVDVKIKRNGNTAEITLIHRNCDYSEDFMDKLQYSLSTQRQCEVEGYYWQLCGDDDSGDELFLVGAMVDEATAEIIDGDLKIHLVRKDMCDL